MLDLPEVIGGRFRVEERIGHGAIAEVVRARDLRDGRAVALKILYPALRETQVVVDRFRREVELCKRIQHPHVLAIHDVAESGQLLFLVMDYQPGGDLADRLARRGPLDAAGVRILAEQLGGALGAAHRVGIVHRDVKPSNVLAGAGPALDVRLCDFGLARSAEGAGLTTATAVLGTPEYMAPEVIADGHADPRSDLYSLGAVLFEAATGRLPFVADSPYQLMRLHLQEPAPRARTLAPSLPPEIDEAIARALAKDPLDRFASAAELVEAFTAASPTAVAPLKPAPVVRAGGCPACGGWLVETAALCVDCGHQLLRLEQQRPGGVSLLVTGPGAPGDKLDATLHVALFRLLGELPPAWTGPDRNRPLLARFARDAAWTPRGRGASRAPRFPFFVARDLTPASAERLLPRLQALGLDVHIERGWALRSRDMRRKVNTIAWRYVAGLGVLTWVSQMPNWIPSGVLPPGSSIFFVPALLLGLPSLFALGVARSSSRPLVRGPAGAAAAALPPAEGPAQELRHLSQRQDRRLVARICARLDRLAGAAGGIDLRPVAARAREVAAALAAVDRADAALGRAAMATPRAQDELRRLERGRVLLRAELLRISSHLEALAAGEAQAHAHQATAALAAAREATAALALEVEADEELERFLAGRVGPP
jgi:hypothetical protein